MARINTNQQGIIIPGKSEIQTAGDCSPLRNPAVALHRIQKIRANVDKLHLAFVRPIGGIGDMLMILPTVKAVRKQYNCYIDMITDPMYLDGALYKVLQGNPYIDNIVDYQDVRTGGYEKYDGVIPMNCPCAWREVPGFSPVIGRIDMFAQHAQIRLDDYQIDYYVTDQEKEWAHQFLTSRRIDPNDRIVLVQSNSSTFTRDLPLNKYKAVIGALTKDKHNKVFVITHGATEPSWGMFGVYHFHNFDVRHIAALMSLSSLVICPDSSILHLAAALNKPTLTLFGPTDPNGRVNTYPSAIAIWGAWDLRCLCVHPNSLVNTENGFKNIKELHIGEKVLTHTGQLSSVTQIHKNPIQNRKILKISIMGQNEPILVTEDHQIYTTYFKNKKTKRNFIPNFSEIILKQAKTITTNDYLCFPIPKETTKKYWLDNEEHKDFWWFVGLFAAEGFLIRQTKGNRQPKVMLALGGREQEIIKKCETIYRTTIKKIFNSKSKSPSLIFNNKGNSIILSCANTGLFVEISKLFQTETTSAATKIIPSVLLTASKTSIKSFLDGYACGDSNFKSPSSKRQITYTTKSRQLAYGIQSLYLRLGIYVQVYQRTRNTNYKQNATIYRIILARNQKSKKRWYKFNEHILVPVKSIQETTTEEQDFYDITVEGEDKSFTIQNFSVYDCWFTTCHNSYSCWSRIDGNLIISTASAMLNNTPIPEHPSIVRYPHFKLQKDQFESL